MAVAVVAGCSQGRVSPAGPSAVAEPTVSAAGAGGAHPSAKPTGGAGTTTVTFAGFEVSTLTVSVNTQTIANLGQPYIDQGRVQLQILVDANGNAVPCGTAGAEYVRFDNFDLGGQAPSSGLTTALVDLDNLDASTGGRVKNVHCGDSICVRAHYVTGGGQTKVDTHLSNPAAFDVVCGGGCTLSQGFWKTHYPASWPGTVLAGGLSVGTVAYTAAELKSILDQAPVGNGLVILAHQLIAAKLNIANGADGSAVAATIAAADALIGSRVVPPVGSGVLAPSETGALTQTLEGFNVGDIGPGHCPS